MTDKQPDALPSLYEITGNITDHNTVLVSLAEIETLRMGYAAARLEIASLQAQLEALTSQAQPVGAAPVAELVTTAHGFETKLSLLPGHFDLPYGAHLLYAVSQLEAQALDARQPIETAPSKEQHHD